MRISRLGYMAMARRWIVRCGCRDAQSGAGAGVGISANNAQREIPTFEEISRQVQIDRLPMWKNAKHGQQR
ncbi:MAG: hypothetical protein WBV62_19280 [Roseobacter sp.]